jgi:Restriction endonuclease
VTTKARTRKTNKVAKTAPTRTPRTTKRRKPGAPPKPTPMSQVVENVVAALERVKADVPGTEIIQKAQVPVYDKPARGPRDVDVLVRTPIGGRSYSLGIDAKDHNRPLDVGHIDKLVGHWRDVRTDRFAVVSTSGFAKDAAEKAREEKLELVTLERFDKSELFKVESGQFIIVVAAQIVHFQVTYSPEILAALAGSPAAAVENPGPDDLTLHSQSGEAVSVGRVLFGLGTRRATERESELLDGQLFEEVCLVPRNEYTKLSHLGHDLPVPHSFSVVYRFCRQLLPDLRYRTDSRELLTFELAGQQVTVVGTPVEGVGTTLTFASGPANPVKVHVDEEK